MQASRCPVDSHRDAFNFPISDVTACVALPIWEAHSVFGVQNAMQCPHD